MNGSSRLCSRANRGSPTRRNNKLSLPPPSYSSTAKGLFPVFWKDKDLSLHKNPPRDGTLDSFATATVFEAESPKGQAIKTNALDAYQTGKSLSQATWDPRAGLAVAAFLR